jgi:hypothetical protein
VGFGESSCSEFTDRGCYTSKVHLFIRLFKRARTYGPVLMMPACLLTEPITPLPPLTDPSPETPPAMQSSACPGSSSSPGAPVILFSDLDSAPNQGGADGRGAFVTLYGLRFGNERGQVLLDGVEVDHYVDWNSSSAIKTARALERVVVQLGARARSGNFVVVAAGQASNPLPFQVRPGKIVFVDSRVGDDGNGSAISPFKHLYRAKGNEVAPGTIIYISGGPYVENDPDATAASLSLSSLAMEQPSSSLPIAYVGDPRSRPELASASAVGVEINSLRHVVIANLVFSGLRGVSTSNPDGLRLIGNEFKTRALSEASVLIGDSALNVSVRGNLFTAGGGIYSFYDRGLDGVEVGWNEFTDTTNLLVQSNGGSSRFTIHDNLFGGARPGVFLSGDVSSEVYNNLFIGSAFAAAGRGTHIVEHNTFARTVSFSVGNASSLANNMALSATNNIVHDDGNKSYYEDDMRVVSFSLSHNLYSGTGAPPLPEETGAIQGDPSFVSALRGDFRPGVTGAAIDSGAATSRCADYFGVARPQRNGVDIGAIEREP